MAGNTAVGWQAGQERAAVVYMQSVVRKCRAMHQPSRLLAIVASSFVKIPRHVHKPEQDVLPIPPGSNRYAYHFANDRL